MQPQAGVPLYVAVRRQISDAIVSGEWPPGTVLPSEVTLAQSLGVAVGTVRRALIELAREGMLSRRRKTGTVVISQTPYFSLRSYVQYFRLHAADGTLVESTPDVRSVTVGTANERERAGLRLAPGADVIRIHRLRLVEGRPTMREQLALNAAILPDFPTELETVPKLIFIHLLERYGLRVTVVNEKLTARLADADDRELLQLDDPAAVLGINGTAFDQSGRPVLISHCAATTAEHVYANEVR